MGDYTDKGRVMGLVVMWGGFLSEGNGRGNKISIRIFYRLR